MFRILQRGEGEALKAGVHGTIAALVGMAALYNGVKAVTADGDWENWINLLIYTPCAFIEGGRAVRHWQQHARRCLPVPGVWDVRDRSESVAAVADACG